MGLFLAQIRKAGPQARGSTLKTAGMHRRRWLSLCMRGVGVRLGAGCACVSRPCGGHVPWYRLPEVGRLTIELSFGPPGCFPRVGYSHKTLVGECQSFENVYA